MRRIAWTGEQAAEAINPSGFLRARRERPCRSRAAEQRYTRAVSLSGLSRASDRRITHLGRRETAALRDFKRADVGVGSFASERCAPGRRCMSASRRKRTCRVASICALIAPEAVVFCLGLGSPCYPLQFLASGNGHEWCRRHSSAPGAHSVFPSFACRRGQAVRQ
jgi:hypothetical protein